jgi:hypothetical protein
MRGEALTCMTANRIPSREYLDFDGKWGHAVLAM